LNRQIPAHAQVDKKVVFGKLNLQEFRPPTDIEDFLPGYSRGKQPG